LEELLEASDSDEFLNKDEAAEKLRRKKLAKAKISKVGQGKWIWALKVFVLSISLSIIFTISSEYFMASTGIVFSIITVLILVSIAILSDIIGVAVTVSSAQPFNSMSARKVRGAKEALILVKNAEKVSVICNDIIGDICGVVSGTAGAAIVGRITANVVDTNVVVLIMALTTAIIAGITISGKSLGKVVAINKSEKIVLYIGRLLAPIWRKSKPKNK
jgi:hypothetical protein